MSDFIWSYIIIPLAVIGLVLEVITFLLPNDTACAHISGFLLPTVIGLFGLVFILYLGIEFLKFMPFFS